MKTAGLLVQALLALAALTGGTSAQPSSSALGSPAAAAAADAVVLSADPTPITYRPIVLWHGMGDTSKGSVVGLERLIRAQLNGSVFLHSIQIGADQTQDFLDSYFKDSNEQVQVACDQLRALSELRAGFTLLGFSQGGQFARALLQRCELPGRKALITFGAQHQGVYGLPKCPGSNLAICDYVRRLLDLGAYRSFVQKHLVQAQYWQDPRDHAGYVRASLFLADVNNERPTKNPLYKQRLTALERFVMVQFDGDTIVVPKQSEQFGFYQTGQAKLVLPMEQTPLYLEDWIGLQTLDQAGKLVKLNVPGDHLQFSHDWFVDAILRPYLSVRADSV